MNKESYQVRELGQLHGETPTFLAIGVFDGVHLGHQQLVESMITAAVRSGARPAVLTFHPHPGKVISGRTGRLYLSTLDDRINYLAELGLSLVITKVFDDEFRQTRAADFIDLLIQTVKLDQLWGGNFGLGYEREGDLKFLQKLGNDRGFSVHQYQAMVEWGGSSVSSSRIRRALIQGNIEEANGCLGRSYRLTGKVIPGDGRGRQLGIPTANLEFWDELVLPANGVYAASATLEKEVYLAAVNIGFRPTVNGHSLNVEAHILDFDNDIYGEDLTLEFAVRIRDEQKFPTLEALVAQIKSDIIKVRALQSTLLVEN
jgi:riboflavin kinase/FMN adenylyltransferase